MNTRLHHSLQTQIFLNKHNTSTTRHLRISEILSKNKFKLTEIIQTAQNFINLAIMQKMRKLKMKLSIQL